MKKYLLLNDENLILKATFSRTTKEGWLEVEDKEPITEKIYATYYIDGAYIFNEALYEEYLANKTTQTTPTKEPTQLDRIEAKLDKSNQDIIDEYTLQLIESGVIA